LVTAALIVAASPPAFAQNWTDPNKPPCDAFKKGLGQGFLVATRDVSVLESIELGQGNVLAVESVKGVNLRKAIETHCPKLRGY
jgi:hypothetical protein